MGRKKHITVPRGFQAGAATCGLKPSGNPDLAIIAADRPCSTAAIFTTNQIVGAPVAYSRTVLDGGNGKTMGIVINAGCSNVCTGAAGLRDARRMATLAAAETGLPGETFLVASTGVIGRRLDMKAVSRGIAAAASSLGTAADDLVARAIMTTDTRPKHAVAACSIGGTKITIAGIAKGAGMIAPSMATMIAVLTTDAAIAPSALRRGLDAAVSRTFNAVTVDGDQSTSDTVAVFASAAAGNRSIGRSGAAFRTFTAALEKVCGALARQIASDGEGATRLVEVTVSGAASDAKARYLAKSVADSPLVKTAVHGADPNWGRIAMALGKCPPSHAIIDPERLSIRICGTKVFARGKGCAFDRKALSKAMKKKTVTIDCRVGRGTGTFTALTCDLSAAYVAINADYTT